MTKQLMMENQRNNGFAEPPAEMTMPEVLDFLKEQEEEFFVTLEFGGLFEEGINCGWEKK